MPVPPNPGPRRDDSADVTPPPIAAAPPISYASAPVRPVAPPPPPQQVPFAIPVAAPLAAEQVEQIAAARKAYKPVKRAISVASFDAWTIALFAAGSLACGFGSASGIFIGVAMGAIAAVEFYGLSRLRRLDVRAPKLLALNQLAFAAMLIAYGAWSLYLAATNPNPLGAAASPEMDQVLGDYSGMMRTLNAAIYGGVIVVAIVVQGGTALFYFSRGNKVREYVQNTPNWILQMQQAGMSL